MSLYKLSELLRFLREAGVKPKKRLSQNFLVDGNILKKIINVANLNKGDTVVEIGSGPGVLTEALLSREACVIAIEKDEKLAKRLKRLQNGKLQVLADDFRNIQFENFLKEEKKIKIVANIPYNLTETIFQKLLPKQNLIESIHLMVQKEVAEKCTANIKSKNYSAFTLFINYHCTAKCLFTVSKTCFYPKPKVDSAILELKLKKPPVDIPREKLFKLIRVAFQMRRKTLCSSLKRFASACEIKAALENLGLPKNSRPQELTLRDFFTLFHILNSKKAQKTQPHTNH